MQNIWLKGPFSTGQIMSSVLKASKAMLTIRALVGQNPSTQRKCPKGLQRIKQPCWKFTFSSFLAMPLLTTTTFWSHTMCQAEPKLLPLNHPNFQGCLKFSKTLWTFLILNYCFSCPGPERPLLSTFTHRILRATWNASLPRSCLFLPRSQETAHLWGPQDGLSGPFLSSQCTVLQLVSWDHLIP